MVKQDLRENGARYTTNINSNDLKIIHVTFKEIMITPRVSNIAPPTGFGCVLCKYILNMYKTIIKIFVKHAQYPYTKKRYRTYIKHHKYMPFRCANI